MANLTDRIALNSGGARGIGGAISEAMCAAGAKVVISALLQEGENKASELTDKGYDASFILHDVTIEAEWNKTVSYCSETYGGLDILVNNAGIYFPKTIEETSLEEWKQMFSFNVEGFS